MGTSTIPGAGNWTPTHFGFSAALQSSSRRDGILAAGVSKSHGDASGDGITHDHWLDLTVHSVESALLERSSSVSSSFAGSCVDHAARSWGRPFAQEVDGS